LFYLGEMYLKSSKWCFDDFGIPLSLPLTGFLTPI